MFVGTVRALEFLGAETSEHEFRWHHVFTCTHLPLSLALPLDLTKCDGTFVFPVQGQFFD